MATPPLSLRVNVIVDTPLAFAAGVYVSVPVVEFTAGATENKPGLVSIYFIAVKERVTSESSDGAQELAQLTFASLLLVRYGN